MKLLERTSQLQALNSALSQVMAGERQGCIALVYGEAGIGKTSLVEHFIRENRKSWRILQGACDSLFTPRPLGPLHDIAAQTQGSLSRLLESESNRTAIFSACLNELQVQATIMVIEDIHWADEATLDLLKYLGRRIRQTPSLIILSYRDDEISQDHPLRILVGDLASSQALHRIPVTPLSIEAVHELAKDKKIDPVELHRLTNGNPFFVTEVLAADSGIPETVRDAVLARAARLTRSARVVLEAAAVIGFRVETWLLSKIVGDEYVYAEECVARGMLQSQGDYYIFRHEIGRQVILDSISSQRKITLHRLTLHALKESRETRGDLTRLANHAEETKDIAAVLEYAPAAARQASALGAHCEAVPHYQATLQFADFLSVKERAELLDAYAKECDLSDQMIDAERAQQEALRLWRLLERRDKEGRALCHLSEIAIKLNWNSEIERYAKEAVAVLETLPPSQELARAYSHMSRLHMVAWQREETIHWGMLAIELAEQLGDVETLAHALCNIGAFDMSYQRQAKLERSLQLSLANGLHNHAGRTYFNMADALLRERDYAVCLRYLDEGFAYCAQNDIDYWRLGLLGLRSHVYLDQGRWSEAIQDIFTAQEFWGTMETRSMVEPILLNLKVRRGDHISPAELDAARELARTTIIIDVSYNLAKLFAEMAWLRSDLEQCRSEVESMFKYSLQNPEPIIIGSLAYWMWRAGAISTPPPNAAEPYAMQIAGNWRNAAAMWEKFGCPYEQGMALMDGDEAAQLEALKIFERLGAQPLVKKLKQQMYAQRIRFPRGPRPATRENPFGLTDREMEVLSRLAEGLSNSAIASRLCISSRTVDHHVASILQKMAAQSRNEVIALALKDNYFHTG